MWNHRDSSIETVERVLSALIYAVPLLFLMGPLFRHEPLRHEGRKQAMSRQNLVPWQRLSFLARDYYDR